MENSGVVVQADKYLSEQTMVELLKEDSLKAFNILYDRYAPALFGAIMRITSEQTLAENVLQQTFTELWNNKQTYKSFKERMFTWMFKIARKLAVNNVRKLNELDQNPGIYNLVYSKEAEDYLAGKNKTAHIEGETEQALRLIYFKTYTIDGAARELNIAMNDLRTKLKLAIEQLNSVAV